MNNKWLQFGILDLERKRGSALFYAKVMRLSKLNYIETSHIRSHDEEQEGKVFRGEIIFAFKDNSQERVLFQSLKEYKNFRLLFMRFLADDAPFSMFTIPCNTINMYVTPIELFQEFLFMSQEQHKAIFSGYRHSTT